VISSIVAGTLSKSVDKDISKFPDFLLFSWITTIKKRGWKTFSRLKQKTWKN
jgi:hypothetical protein